MLALLVGLGCCALLQRHSFTYADAGSLLSPDHVYRLDCRKRRSFPQTDLFDPAIVVQFRLVRADTGQVVAEQFVALDEDSDFASPAWPHPSGLRCAWSASGVTVRDYDDRRPAAVVELRYR